MDYSKIFFLFLNEKYVVTPHLNCLCETVLMRGHSLCFFGINKETYPCYHFLSGALVSSCILWIRSAELPGMPDKMFTRNSLRIEEDKDRYGARRCKL